MLLVVVFMVIGGIAVSLLNADRPLTGPGWQLIIAGMLYLLFFYPLSRLASSQSIGLSLTLYFAVMLALTAWMSVSLVGLGVLGVGVLLFMPLLGLAAATFTWFGLTTVLCLCAAQFLWAAWQLGGLELLPEAILGFSAGAAFVIMLVRLALREQAAHREIALLNARLWEQLHHSEALATERERVRLAREIHDGLGHRLTGAGIQLEVAEAHLGSEPDTARTALNRARNSIRQGLADLRGTVSSLRQSPLDGQSLPESIAELVAEAELNGLVINYQCYGAPRILPPAVGLALYRGVQEGLSNVLKHAMASRARVVLDYSVADTTSIAIEDDGQGAYGTISEGVGLQGLAERARLIGGRFEAGNRDGKGFCLQMMVPG